LPIVSAVLKELLLKHCLHIAKLKFMKSSVCFHPLMQKLQLRYVVH